MRRLALIAIVLCGVCAVFAYGVWVGLYKKPPYSTVRSVYRFARTKLSGNSYEPAVPLVVEDYWRRNIDSLITIRTPDDVLSKRKALVDFIWKGQGFPAGDSVAVEEAIDDPRCSDLENLRQVDKYTISMDFGVKSIAYHFHAERHNNKLVIYHQGHRGDFFVGEKHIRFFLKHNYSVLAFAMPLMGMNNTPVVDLGRLGEVKLAAHDYLILLDSEDHSSIKFFAEPVVTALNHLEKHYDYDGVYMVGISGGGWTTVLCSALDPRILRNYPVQGSAEPIFLRYFIGDYEQHHPGLFRTANYMELYVLASYGAGRGQLFIFNAYDPQSGFGSRAELYVERVKAVLNELGSGEFDIYLDPENRKHIIGEHSLLAILADMNEAPGGSTAR